MTYAPTGMGKRRKNAGPRPVAARPCVFHDCWRVGVEQYEYPYPGMALVGLEGPQWYCRKHLATVKRLAEKSRRMREEGTTQAT